MNAWVCAHYAEVLAFASGGGNTVTCFGDVADATECSGPPR